MKIIKSFFLLTVGFCSATILYAQELKPEIAKPVEIKTPEAPKTNTPSNRTELKSQPQAVAITTEASAKTTETPSPSTGKENAKPEGKEKLEVKTFNKNDIATPDGEEGRKIMNGNSTRPKEPILTPATTNPKVTPPVVKPASLKNGQQQQ